MNKSTRIQPILWGLMACISLPMASVHADESRTFTHTADIRAGREDALLDIFKSISEKFENEYRALGAAYTTGEILYRQRRYDDAAKNFETVVSRGKKYAYLSDAARLRLSQSSLLLGDDEAALRVARDVAGSNNKFLSAEGWYTLARSYLAKGRLERADEAFKNTLTVNPVYGDLLKVDLLAGLLSFERGNYLDAVSHFQRHPDDVPSLYYSIASFCQMKDIAKAVSAYQKLLASAKKGVWVDRARILIGEAIYQTRDHDLAMTFFGPVSRRDALPELRVLALYRLACIDFQKKNYSRCELTLQNLLKEFPNHTLRTDWTYLLATIPVYQRDWTRTLKDEGRYNSTGHGVAPGPRSIPPEQLAPEAQFRTLWALMALGNYNEVIKQTDKFFKKYPKNPLTGYSLLLQGVAFDQQGDTEKAIDSYQTLVDLFPQSPAAGKAVYLMTLSLRRANQSSRIVSALNRLNDNLQRQEEIKSDEWRKNTMFWIAEGYYSIQDWKHAEQTYKKFVELSPDNALIPYALEGLAASMAAQGQDRLDQAKVYMQQAIQRGQELNATAVSSDAKLQLGKIYYNQKGFDSATAQFDAYVQESTNTARVAEALYSSGKSLYNQQYYTEAINRWKQLIDGYRFSPYRVKGYWETGETQFGLGHYDQAIAAYQSLAANYPNTQESQDAQYKIIMSYFNKNDLRGTYQQFTAYKTNYPADLDRIKSLCGMLLNAYQGQSATSGIHSAELSDLLRACPGDASGASILWERGAALFNKKDYAAAQKYFQRIMVSYPGEEFASQAFYYNAECYFFLQKWDEAASAYKSYYINYPNDKMVPQAMFQVGVSFFSKKDYPKAAEGFQEFIDRYPQNALAKDAALNIALCDKKAFRLVEAIKAYQNYLDLFPGDAKTAFVLLQVGSLYATKGDFAQAITNLEKVSTGAPERTEAQYRIGDAYENLHQDAKATQAFKQLLPMGPCDNEFRIAGLLELAKMTEATGSTNGLSPVYSSIASCSKNSQIKAAAEQKLQELKGGQ
jgi:TolA-binding protein